MSDDKEGSLARFEVRPGRGDWIGGCMACNGRFERVIEFTVGIFQARLCPKCAADLAKALKPRRAAK